MAHLTTAHASKKSAAPKRRVTSMHISRAKNGFSVRTHHEPMSVGASRQQAMAMHDNSTEETVHGSVASLKKHIHEKFAGLDSDVGLEGPDKGDAAQQASVPMG